VSILTTDLLAFASASMPEDDASTSGGAIDTATRVEFTDISAVDTVSMVSSAADTRSVTVTGRNAAGAIVTDTKSLNGTTPVVTTQTFERILKIIIASSGAQTVTFTKTSGGANIATLGPNITGVRRFFYNSASQAGATLRYEKLFWKNENASLTLNSAQMTLTADPAAKIRIACEAAVGGTQSVANRLTVPSSITLVDDGVAQNVPGGALAAAAAIGVWVELSLLASDAAIKNTFTTQLSGTSV